MLITQLKPKDTIVSLSEGKTALIICEGCKEVYFPESEAAELQREMLSDGTASAAIVTDYICNPENTRLRFEKYKDIIDTADTVMVLSCGVGVQTVAEILESKKVCSGCDTYPLPGFQGVTPTEYDCAQCGECYLNQTGGICPITACSKSLLNGQCGGAKNGMCEVDKNMECGWERIYRKLEKLKRLNTLDHPAEIRNYATEERES